MSREQKQKLFRIMISGVLLIAGMLAPDKISAVLLLISYVTIGYDVLYVAIRNIGEGRFLDEQFLMTVATVGAIFLQEFPEAVFVMLFYQVGELFQGYAVGKNRKSITDLMELAPNTAWTEENGNMVARTPAEIQVGQTVVVKPGEKIPVDGVVKTGVSALNTAPLTGESMPREVGPGDEVLSGCVNQKNLLKICATKEFSDSAVSQILELVENAVSSKAKTEQFITRFANWYTPVVVLCAVLLAVIPSLVGLESWVVCCKRALNFLVVSCPCALVISVPLSFFGGIGRASKNGILIKGSQFVEVLAKTKTVVFDKTGTLTEGSFVVSEIMSEKPEETLKLAALAESGSDHPIAQSLRRKYGKKIRTVSEFEEIPGCGIKARVEGRTVLAGNRNLMEQNDIHCPALEGLGTHVFVAADGEFYGVIKITDKPKQEAVAAIRSLKKRENCRIVMCTGDRRQEADATAEQLGISEVYAELLPQDKVALLNDILSTEHKGSVLFVGDGMNDAPVLALADAGIAMGALGTDAAIEAADVVLMDDNPSKLPVALDVARKTMRIVRQNIIFALGIKLAVLMLSVFGLAGMWEAVFADVGVSVLAICNSMRTLYEKGREE